MTALRELAERWKDANRGETLYAEGKTAGMHACAAELLSTLDAEGDGGAVAELVVDRDSGNREWFDIKVFDRTLPHGTKLYTHPARSGVVRDEDVIHAWGVFCHSKEIADATTGDKNTLAHMRAALESFARITP